MGKKWRGKSATRGRGVRRLMASVMKNIHFFGSPPEALYGLDNEHLCTRVRQFVYPCDSFRWLCALTTYCVTWHTAQGHFCITHSGTALYPCDRSLCRWSRKMSWSLHAFCVHGQGLLKHIWVARPQIVPQPIGKEHFCVVRPCLYHYHAHVTFLRAHLPWNRHKSPKPSNQ